MESGTVHNRQFNYPFTEFVVFVIGMRVNKLWTLHKWIPTDA